MSSVRGQYLALVTKEEDSDWNVVFRDLPGCVTAGRSLVEAVAFAEEALALHVHGLREDGDAPPVPSDIEDVMADPELVGGLFCLVPLKPLAGLAGRTSRVNITLDEDLLAEIDAAAKQIGSDRSKFLAACSQGARQPGRSGRSEPFGLAARK